MLNLKATPEDAKLIGQIVARFSTAYEAEICAPTRRMNLEMDITACHLNGCPLDLQGLLGASDFEFAHDVQGIRIHIDRATGHLFGCFSPRYARKEN